MDSFSISFVGKTGVGKSSCISCLVGDSTIGNAMLGENFLGKTKTNINYKLHKDKVNTSISVEINSNYIEKFIIKGDKVDEKEESGREIDYSNLIETVTKVFGNLDFPIDNQDDLDVVVSKVGKSIKSYIDSIINSKNYIDIFNKNLDYINFISSVSIVCEMSDIAKELIEVDILECIDTRGVFDNDSNIERIIPNSIATIIIIPGIGESEETIKTICDRISGVFRRPVSLLVRDNSYDLDPSFGVDEEVNRYINGKDEYKKYGEELKHIMQEKGYMPNENLLEGKDIYYNLLTNSSVNVLPTVAKHRCEKTFKKFDWSVFQKVVCKSVNKIIKTYTDIQDAAKRVIENCDKEILDFINGEINKLSVEYAKNACTGYIKGSQQQPRPDTMIKNSLARYNYNFARQKYNLASEYWIKEYIHHYVTVAAAEVLGDLSDNIVKELDNLPFEDKIKDQLIVLIRGIYQYICKLTASEGYKWWTGSIIEVRTGIESYNRSIDVLGEIYKKYKGGEFYYKSYREGPNNCPRSIMFILISQSARSEVAKFVNDENGLKSMLPTIIKEYDNI